MCSTFPTARWFELTDRAEPHASVASARDRSSIPPGQPRGGETRGFRGAVGSARQLRAEAPPRSLSCQPATGAATDRGPGSIQQRDEPSRERFDPQRSAPAARLDSSVPPGRSDCPSRSQSRSAGPNGSRPTSSHSDGSGCHVPARPGSQPHPPGRRAGHAPCNPVSRAPAATPPDAASRGPSNGCTSCLASGFNPPRAAPVASNAARAGRLPPSAECPPDQPQCRVRQISLCNFAVIDVEQPPSQPRPPDRTPATAGPSGDHDDRPHF